MPMTHAVTRSRNRRQKTGVGFWRRFLERVLWALVGIFKELEQALLVCRGG